MQNAKKALTLIRQAQGTLDKVARMIEEGAYCPEVIQQADSAMGLIRTLKREVLASHLDTCVQTGLNTDKEKTIKEMIKIYRLSE